MKRILLLLFLFPVDVGAYCLQTFQSLDGYPTWQQEVPYYVSSNLEDQGILDAIDAAFATWGNVPCSTLKFKKAGTFELNSVPFKDTPFGIHIFWHLEEASYPTVSKYISYAYLGVEESGEITGGSLALNAFSVKWTTTGELEAFDMQGEMTERVGQVIGLETSNAPESVMSKTLNYNDLGKRTLKEDDLNGLRFLYGESCAVQPPVPEAGGCAPPPATPPGPPPEVPAEPDGGMPDSAPSPTPTPTPTPPSSDGGMSLPPPTAASGSCTSSAECAPGEQCAPAGVCLPADDSGCAIGADPLISPWLLLILLLWPLRYNLQKR